MTLRQLKWVAILVLSIAIGLLEVVRHSFLHDALPVMWGNIIVTALAFMGIFILAQLLFGRIARLQEAVLQRNRELSSVNRLALSVGRSLNPEEESRVALERIVQETGAIGGEVFLLQQGELVPATPGEEDPDKLERARQAARHGSTMLVKVPEGYWAFVPLKGKELLGVVCLYRHQPFLPHNTELMDLMGRYIGSALENAKLVARIEELAVVEERDRLAREMHDGLAQILGLLSLKAANSQRLLGQGQHPKAESELRDMERIAQEAYADTREVILGLRSQVKLDGGFAQNLTEYLHKFQRQSGVPTQMVVEGGRQLHFSPRAEVQLIRIIQEALSNVRKHARAKHAWVGFSWANGIARVKVEDDGHGFDVTGVMGRTEGFGLQAMRERADSVSGQLRIEPRPGGGTVIEVQLPVEE